MVERLPKLLSVNFHPVHPERATLVFDRELTLKQEQELRDLIGYQFAGQLRRDPDAPQTAPAQPGEG